MGHRVLYMLFACIASTVSGSRTPAANLNLNIQSAERSVEGHQVAALRMLMKEEMEKERTEIRKLIREEMILQGKAIRDQVSFCKDSGTIRDDVVFLKETILELRREIMRDQRDNSNSFVETRLDLRMSATHPRKSRSKSLGQVRNAQKVTSKRSSKSLGERAQNTGFFGFGAKASSSTGSSSRSGSAKNSSFFGMGKMFNNMTGSVGKQLDSMANSAVNSFPLTTEWMQNLQRSGMQLYGEYEATLLGVTNKLGAGLNSAFKSLQKASKYMWDQIQKVGFGKFLLQMLGDVLKMSLKSATGLLVETVAHKVADIFADEGIDWIGDCLSQVVAGLVGSSGFPGAGALGIAVSEMLKKGITFVQWLKLPAVKPQLDKMMAWTKEIVFQAEGKLFEHLNVLASEFWTSRVGRFVDEIQEYFCRTMPQLCSSMGFKMKQALFQMASIENTSTNTSASSHKVSSGKRYGHNTSSKGAQLEMLPPCAIEDCDRIPKLPPSSREGSNKTVK